MKLPVPRLIAVCTLSLFVAMNSRAARVQFSAADPTGAPLKNALIILKSLDDRHEVFRALSDASGLVPVVDLKGGLYRVIATFPYAPWSTAVREFIVEHEPLNLVLTLDATGTQDDYATVGAPPQTIQILRPNGTPASQVLVIARDRTATSEKWYKSNDSGEAVLEMFANPMVLVVVTPPKVFEKVISFGSRMESSPVRKDTSRAMSRQKTKATIIIRLP